MSLLKTLLFTYWSKEKQTRWYHFGLDLLERQYIRIPLYMHAHRKILPSGWIDLLPCGLCILKLRLHINCHFFQLLQGCLHLFIIQNPCIMNKRNEKNSLKIVIHTLDYIYRYGYMYSYYCIKSTCITDSIANKFIPIGMSIRGDWNYLTQLAN